MTAQLKTSLAHWPEVSRAVFVPHSRREYDRLVLLLDDLIDEVGEDKTTRSLRSWKSSDCSLRNTKTKPCPNFPDAHVSSGS